MGQPRPGPAFLKIGNHRRYLPADVKAWLLQNRRAPGEATK
jgi:hypothetical protein